MPGWFDIVTRLGLPLLTFVVAVVGALYTAGQFVRAKRVRAVDLAIAMIAHLDTVPELAFACQALDWGVGPLIVPERYRPLLEKTPEQAGRPLTPEERGMIFDHDVALMIVALKPNLETEILQRPEGLVYRYCFDKLFQHLSNVDRLVVSGQINMEDLSALKYWLVLIREYRYFPEAAMRQKVFQPFVKAFGYGGLIHLAERLGIKDWNG